MLSGFPLLSSFPPFPLFHNPQLSDSPPTTRQICNDTHPPNRAHAFEHAHAPPTLARGHPCTRAHSSGDTHSRFLVRFAESRRICELSGKRGCKHRFAPCEAADHSRAHRATAPRSPLRHTHSHAHPSRCCTLFTGTAKNADSTLPTRASESSKWPALHRSRF